jgi:F-type H+-transporting ATPase subunit a
VNVGTIHKATLNLPFLGDLVVNDVTIRMMILTFVLVAIGSFFLGRKLILRPGKLQCLTELLVGGFYDLVEETLGDKAKTFFPLIMTIFLFVLLANWIGIFPGMASPTEDLNVCISLAFIVFLVAHGMGIKKKGLWGYLKSYAEPSLLMLPLNVIGEIGQTLSHCFRLFGNIFGGGIIFALVPFVTFSILASLGVPDIATATFSEMGIVEWITYIVLSPVIAVLYFVAYAFFGLFAGTVQALVFTMLALTYVSLQIEEG